MSALKELQNLLPHDENPYVQKWRKDGGRVVGFTCGYVPEEIIHANGLMPYKVDARGETETSLADIYMHRFNCTYSRCVLQAGLSGKYDFLDGFCFLNGCEQLRRLYEIWDKHLDTDYQYMVTMPHKITDSGYEWYRDEIVGFKENLMTNFGMRCSNDDLANSIKVYNETRSLISELNALRKGEEVLVTGSEAMAIMVSSGTMLREDYNALLRQALDEIKQRNKRFDYQARLLVGGSALDSPEFMRLIEEMGGMVVADTLCAGSRFFLNPVEVDDNPQEAIIRRYYHNNPCPRMMNEFDNRLDFTERMARDARVDGVILQKIVFCDNHAVECTMQADDLEERGIPVLSLEREHMLSDVGRLKTRIEAFMERIAREVEK